MKFNYYYGSEADQFSFIRIPKIMLIDKVFQTLSMAAKVLYGVLLYKCYSESEPLEHKTLT